MSNDPQIEQAIRTVDQSSAEFWGGPDGARAVLRAAIAASPVDTASVDAFVDAVFQHSQTVNPETPNDQAFRNGASFAMSLNEFGLGQYAPKPDVAVDGQCPHCRHAAHDSRMCLNMASDNECGVGCDLRAALSPEEIEAGQTYMEAYEIWKQHGQAMHAVLLRIWKAVTPDSKHMTFGLDPEEVWLSVRGFLNSAHEATPTAGPHPTSTERDHR